MANPRTPSVPNIRGMFPHPRFSQRLLPCTIVPAPGHDHPRQVACPQHPPHPRRPVPAYSRFRPAQRPYAGSRAKPDIYLHLIEQVIAGTARQGSIYLSRQEFSSHGRQRRDHHLDPLERTISMTILYDASDRRFHLTNGSISYVMRVFDGGRTRPHMLRPRAARRNGRRGDGSTSRRRRPRTPMTPTRWRTCTWNTRRRVPEI